MNTLGLIDETSRTDSDVVLARSANAGLPRLPFNADDEVSLNESPRRR